MANAYKADRDLLTWRDNGVSSRPRVACILHTDESAYDYANNRVRDEGWTADRLAEYNIEAPNDPNRGSYHLGVDKTGRVVRQNDDIFGTWSVANIGNDICYHFCFAGTTAYFTRDQWLARQVQLDTMAKVVAAYCKAYGIPVVRRRGHELRAGARGIAGHWDCTQAWSNGSGHWDPGGYPGETAGGFPWDVFVDMVKAHYDGGAPATPPPTQGKETDMFGPVQVAALNEAKVAALDALKALTDGVTSIINPAKRIPPRLMLALIDAATWEQRVLLNEVARKLDIDPDAVVSEAIARDRGGK